MKRRQRALVTGGAGLIGSHVADLLVREGWRVRILDNLEPNTHRRGKPAWINRDAEFVHGDLRDRATIENALSDIDIVFHQAAYGGYMPEMAKYGLWINQSRSGEIGPALGKTSWDSSRCAAVLVHLRTPTIDLQSLHRCDRDFLHPFA